MSLLKMGIVVVTPKGGIFRSKSLKITPFEVTTTPYFNSVQMICNHCDLHGYHMDVFIAGSTYCVQLRKTGQLAQVEQLMQDAKTARMKQLCARIINCCEEYKEI